MQFLLLLSALLSAVTGAFAGPRAVEAPVSQTEAQHAVAARTPVRAQAPARQPLADAKDGRVEAGFVAPEPAAMAADAPLANVRLIE